MLFSRRVTTLFTLTAAAAVALAGCGSGKTVDEKGKSADVSVAKEKSLGDSLPTSIRTKGYLTMATDPSYPPIEFTKSSGGYQGFDIDLANAIGRTLGVKIQIKKAQFDGILAGINAKRYDFAMSAFTDNAEREKGNDFVTYFKAGTSIGVKTGNPKKIKTQADLCGLTVGAEKGTIQATALTQNKSDGAITLRGQCLKDGKKTPKPLLLPTQSDVDNAVVSGRADAFTGDTPVVEYQGKLKDGQLELAGETTDVGPYGIAFPKGSPLVEIFHKAMTLLIKNGTYQKIIDTWGLKAGAVTSSEINGAS